MSIWISVKIYCSFVTFVALFFVAVVQDENVDSDEVDSDDFDDTAQNLEDNVEEDDDGRHARMLQEITGLPSDAFGGKIELQITYLKKLP